MPTPIEAKRTRSPGLTDSTAWAARVKWRPEARVAAELSWRKLRRESWGMWVLGLGGTGTTIADGCGVGARTRLEVENRGKAAEDKEGEVDASRSLKVVLVVLSCPANGGDEMEAFHVHAK